MDSIEFVHDCGALVQITTYSLIPGTKEWERAVSDGYIDPGADPLLHNDSIYPFPWCRTGLDDFQQAKALALSGNRFLTPAT